jgi:nucleotide-binding universal stress UspA family protein
VTAPTLAFGDDRSPAADHCWRWIDAHRWDRWRLEVITAEPPPFGPPLSPEETELHPWEPPAARVPSAGAGFVDAVHLTAKLDPRIALSRPVDLLAIGPRGPGLLKALHLGSTAEWLLQQPPAPLVVTRSEGPVATVLVCHDGSPHADAAAAAFARFPWAGDVSVTVLVVDDGRTDVEAAREMAETTLAGIAADVETVKVKGSPTGEILDEVERRSADLLVLGTRGLTGLSRMTVGSTAAAISRSATCSVLAAHADESAFGLDPKY